MLQLINVSIYRKLNSAVTCATNHNVNCHQLKNYPSRSEDIAMVNCQAYESIKSTSKASAEITEGAAIYETVEKRLCDY